MTGTGYTRRSAGFLAMVAAIASVVAGCGSGDSGTAQTDTGAHAGQRAPVTGRQTSAPKFVRAIERAAPEQIARVCLSVKAKGEDAAFHLFKKGYEGAFPEETIAAKAVFDEIVERCA